MNCGPYSNCLKIVNRLSKMHGNVIRTSERRTVVLSQTFGVRLEGHVLLFIGYVVLNKYPHTSKHCRIQVAWRKFMPKAQVVNYAAYLRKVTTTMLDYLTTTHSSYPHFAIVVESYIESWKDSKQNNFSLHITELGSLIFLLIICRKRQRNQGTTKSKEMWCYLSQH